MSHTSAAARAANGSHHSSARRAARSSAARSGAKVFLVTAAPYLGEDLCATYRLWLEPDETLDAALAQLGWRVNDIDIVINSHLHWDHSDNNRRLPNARFYVSLAEWEYAKNPISIQKKLYIHDWSSAPLSIMNYVLVNQDLFEVVPGIKTIETPGHSAGHRIPRGVAHRDVNALVYADVLDALLLELAVERRAGAVDE